MAVKPVLDLEIKGFDKFERTMELFKQYKKGIKEIAPRLRMGEAAIQAMALATAQATEEQEKYNKAIERQEAAREKADRAKDKRDRDRLKAMKNTSESITNLLMKGTDSLLKLVGIGGALGGLLGIGGLFGLDKLAGAVSNTRTQSLQAGVSAGQMNAFRVNFGRYGLDPSLLQTVADAQNQQQKWGWFSALGIQNFRNMNPADLTMEIMRRSADTWNRGEKTEGYARAHGLLEFLSLGQLRELGTLQQKGELGRMFGRYNNDVNRFARDDQTSQAWQDFLGKLQEAGQTIENSLVVSLQKAHLPEMLGKLSDVLSETISKFLTSPEFGKWLQEASDGLKSLGEYISSPEARKNFHDFIQNVGDVADWLQGVLIRLNIIKDHTQPTGYEPKKPTEDLQRGIWNRVTGGLAATTGMNPATHASVAGRYSINGKDLIDRIYQAESASGRFIGRSPKGALGPFQLMEGTARDYGVHDRMSFSQSRAAAGKYLGDLIAMFHGDIRKAVAAYNWGQGNVMKDVRKHGADWEHFIPAETKGYLNKVLPLMIRVQVTTPPGTNVHAQANAATH